MAAIDGGGLVAAALAAEGVRCLFTVSGGGLMPIYNACAEQGIRVVHTRTEGAAAFMADGWARTTGQPGVCLVTLGPGVSNAVTGLLSATMASVPFVLLAGRAPIGVADLGTPQGTEQLPLVRPVTKYARTVYEPRRIPEYLAAAFRQARGGRPGPVYLEFPADVLGATIDDSTVAPAAPGRLPSRPMADPAAVAAAAALIHRAQRPIVVSGSGVWWSGASEELRAFVATVGAPAFTGRMSRGAVPPGDPCYGGIASVSVNDVFLKAVGACDLVVLVGGRFDHMLGFGRPPTFSAAAKAIQIDIAAEEIGRNRPVDVGIVADAKTALCQLRDALGEPQAREDWLAQVRAERGRVIGERVALELSDEVPIHPLRLLREIRQALAPGAVVAVGSGDIDFWGESYFEPDEAGCYLRSGQVGALGSDIPYGVAAKLAHPDRQVLVLVGDGGFGYAAMELETAVRQRAPLVVVIGNDRAWGMIQRQQGYVYGKKGQVATDLTDCAYEKVAEALGGYGERVREPGQLKGALARAFAAGVPACLNVDIAGVPSPELNYMFRSMKRLV